MANRGGGFFVGAVRRWAHRLPMQLAVLAAVLLGYNEFAVYYLQIAQCSWPTLNSTTTGDTIPMPPPPPPTPAQRSVRALILADVHLLGPLRGHWFDRLRREWQMHRAFQTAINLHRPDVVFMLGDLFDEGQHVDAGAFAAYVERYRRLFHVPASVRVFGALGNHDVGFHYRMHPVALQRFERAGVFGNRVEKAALVEVGGVSFVLLNSMAMHGDGCRLCRETEQRVRMIARRLDCRRADADPAKCANRTEAERALEYSAPVLLQHFPTWRPSEAACEERGTRVGGEEEEEVLRERWEVLSESATRWLGDELRPRVVFSGHAHRWCRTRTLWGAPEWTVNSFSWRNNDDPGFLMVAFGVRGQAVGVCEMPRESTVLWVYAGGAVLAAVAVLRALAGRARRWWRQRKGYEKVK